MSVMPKMYAVGEAGDWFVNGTSDPMADGKAGLRPIHPSMRLVTSQKW